MTTLPSRPNVRGPRPAKYRELTPRIETDAQGFQQWWYGDKKGRNLGLNAVAGKPREMYNVKPSMYDRNAAGLFRHPRAVA